MRGPLLIGAFCQNPLALARISTYHATNKAPNMAVAALSEAQQVVTSLNQHVCVHLQQPKYALFELHC